MKTIAEGFANKDFIIAKEEFDNIMTKKANMMYKGMKKEVAKSLFTEELTDEQKEKREEIAKALAKKHPDMSMSRKMAIATKLATEMA